MRIAFFVNDVATEKAGYTTTRLARAAAAQGHEVWYLGSDDFAYDPDETVHARARRAPPEPTSDLEPFLGAVQSDDNPPERIAVDDLDVLMLRNDPADDYLERPWAQAVGIIFGDLASARGVMVLNDPIGLSRALNKLYFQTFPSSVRPETLVTRDGGEARAFVGRHQGSAVLKPLQGSGGQSVFVVGPAEDNNLPQMIEAVARDGYIVAQEYLPDAAKGDLRLLMLDGRPLEVDGHYAAFRRVPPDGDARSNMSAGGGSAPAEVDDAVLALAEAVGPKLVADGMFLAGVDIVGDKVVEVNVFSPGGLGSAGRFEGVDFAAAVVDAVATRLEEHRAAGVV